MVHKIGFSLATTLVGAVVLLVLLPSLSGSLHLHLPTFQASLPVLKPQVVGIDWDLQNKLPPWMTSITEGAEQGVAVLLGQSLKPDGSAPQVLLDRAQMAKELLHQGRVVKVIVSGADPAGVGHTEASATAAVLMDIGVPADAILQESQATTTAENAWFILRWIPKGTGKVFIITSDFHIARATYIFQEVFAHFYRSLEETYRNDVRWKSSSKRYPRLEVIQAPTASFCGGDATLNKDHDPKADINSYSLAKRAKDELRFLASGDVATSLYGEPLSHTMYIWPIQVNVTLDPQNTRNFHHALKQSMAVADALCKCVSPSERQGPELRYPLKFPIRPFEGPKGWQEICPLVETS